MATAELDDARRGHIGSTHIMIVAVRSCRRLRLLRSNILNAKSLRLQVVHQARAAQVMVEEAEGVVDLGRWDEIVQNNVAVRLKGRFVLWAWRGRGRG